MEETKDSRTILTYSPKKDLIIFIAILGILMAIIYFFKIWYQFCFNLLMLGYFIFRRMREATVFFAVLLRTILYPLGRTKKHFDERLKKAEKEFKETVQPVSHPIMMDKIKRQWLASFRGIVCFDWFYFLFYSMNALVVAWIFLQDFTPQRIGQELYTKFLMPTFPLSTVAWIPLVGMVNLTEVNLLLNFYSAIGAGLVGLTEIIINKKTARKELFMYLVCFPLGAYFITIWVPAGFEFSLIIFEGLTIAIILIEKILGSRAFKFFFVREEKE